MQIIDGRRSYIAGRWVEGERSFEVENPADESCFAEAGVTPLPEVRRAIAEARRAFDQGVWADLPVPERARILHTFLDEVEKSRDTLIDTIMGEAGRPRPMAEGAQVAMGLTFGRQTIDLYQSMSHEEANPVPVDELVRGRVLLSIRRHEPIGVVSAITPYNGGHHHGLQKLIPALMAGNSVILRPVRSTPVSSLVFGAAADAAGLPNGVLSMVVEDGAQGAELLTTDPAVDMVSFTGSTAVGRRILLRRPDRKAGLSGTGWQVGADLSCRRLERVGMGAVAVMAMTSGQACVAATRMLVPTSGRPKSGVGLRDLREDQGGGPPIPKSLMGPVISAGQTGAL